MPETKRRYCIISPGRDEAAYMRRTLDSVIAQSVPPALWVIVDDGSTDDSPQILAEYEAKHDFIRVVRREDRGKRSVGPGVIDAFYAGLQNVNLEDYHYICKLDLDLDLPPRYFERLMEMMEQDPRLGSISGKTYYIDKDTQQLVMEQISDDMSIGASKFLRRQAFEQIGGFVRKVMWDGIDCHRCRMLGWKAGSFDEPELRFEHLRPMGSSDKNILRGRRRHGEGQYYMGTAFWYVTASAIFRLNKAPRVIGALVMWWAFVASMLSRAPRLDDREFRRYLRRYHQLILFRGKAQATVAVEAEHEDRWHPEAEPAWPMPAPSNSTQLQTDLARL